tara:strand:+ start:1020 stop:1373 length:354 start_codon:yes stop_codon:yes gene_type:complete
MKTAPWTGKQHGGLAWCLDLDTASPEELHKTTNDCAQGGRWYCGVRGSKALARRLDVRPADLETLIACAWNLIAKRSCEACGDEVGARIYEQIVTTLASELPEELTWRPTTTTDEES